MIFLISLITIILLVLGGGAWNSDPILALGSIAIGVILYGVLVSFLQSLIREGKSNNVVLNHHMTLGNLVEAIPTQTLPVYVQTVEGRVRSVMSAFTARFDGQDILILEEETPDATEESHP